MIPVIIAVLGGLIILAALLFFAWFVPWGTRWGATAAEIAMSMSGDVRTNEGPPGRLTVPMTRAINIAAPPQDVWPWLAQLGRGAGFYSMDRLDNGGKKSARHIVSWIPQPALGDATAIGYLHHIEPGRELGWWAPGERWFGTTVRMAVTLRVTPQDEASRLVIRVVGDAFGPATLLVKYIFILIDTIMAIKQLKTIKRLVETHGTRNSNPDAPESGARDQFQYYEFIYAGGERGGVPGKEQGAIWYRAAVDDLGERLGRSR